MTKKKKGEFPADFFSSRLSKSASRKAESLDFALKSEKPKTIALFFVPLLSTQAFATVGRPKGGFRSRHAVPPI